MTRQCLPIESPVSSPYCPPGSVYFLPKPLADEVAAMHRARTQKERMRHARAAVRILKATDPKKMAAIINIGKETP